MFKPFIKIKLVQFLILWGVPTRFDNSSTLIAKSIPSSRFSINTHLKFLEAWCQNIGEKFIVWDNVYFFNLFHRGPTFEHEYVFSPGWVWCITYIRDLLHLSNDYYLNVILALIVSNLCQLVTTYVIYYYSLKIFLQIPFFNKQASKLSKLTALYYVLSPGGIFLMTYSENLASFLAITGLYLREISLNYHLKIFTIKSPIYFVSGLIIGLSYSVRANCLLLGVFYLYDLYMFARDHNYLSALASILTGLPLAVNLLWSTYYTYKIFCPGREWCTNKFPSLFQYCQQHYWNNGFLNYWTINNIPNFLLALPIIIINIKSICLIQTYPNKIFIPYAILNVLLLIGGIGFWNVQILTRILNINPLMYWYLSVTDKNWILVGLIFWIVFQTGLYGAFLPPA